MPARGLLRLSSQLRLNDRLCERTPLHHLFSRESSATFATATQKNSTLLAPQPPRSVRRLGLGCRHCVPHSCLCHGLIMFCTATVHLRYWRCRYARRPYGQYSAHEVREEVRGGLLLEKPDDCTDEMYAYPRIPRSAVHVPAHAYRKLLCLHLCGDVSARTSASAPAPPPPPPPPLDTLMFLPQRIDTPGQANAVERTLPCTVQITPPCVVKLILPCNWRYLAL